MPFLRIENHVSSDQSAENIRRELVVKLDLITAPVRTVSTILGIRRICRHPRGLLSQYCNYLQTTYTTLLWLSALVFCVYAWLSSAPFWLTSVSFSGLIDLSLLIWWEYVDGVEQIKSRLESASSGVGFLRHFDEVRPAMKRSVQFITTTSIFVMLFGVLLIFHHKLDTPIGQSSMDFWPNDKDFVAVIRLFSLGILSILPASGSMALALALILASKAEYKLHREQFSEDPNTFQTAVCRHYICAHRRLARFFSLFRHPLSIWISVQITLATIGVLVVFRQILLLDFDAADVPLISLIGRMFLLILWSSRVTILLWAAAKLAAEKAKFADALILRLLDCAALQEQAYWLCTVYADRLIRRPAGLMYFFIAVIDAKLAGTWAALVGCAALLVLCFGTTSRQS